MLTQDGDGKYKLSGREYYGLLCMVGAINEMELHGGYLKERLRKIPNGWRDYRLAQSLLASLFPAVLRTIPGRKIRAIEQEIRHAKIKLEINPVTIGDFDGVTYIEQQALMDAVNYIIGMNCFMCELRGADVKRCKVRKLLDSMMHYNVDPNPDGSCPCEGVLEVERMNPRD